MRSKKFNAQNKRIEDEVIEPQWEPIRIQYQLASDNYQSEHKDFFQDLISITTTFITRYFLIQRSSNQTITFDSTDIQYFEEKNISISFIDQQFDADLLIFIILSSNEINKVKTSSTYFKTNPKTKRPMVGYIQWNTFYLNLTDMTNTYFEQNTQRLIKASMAIMGFYFQSFINYFDGSTNQTYPDVLFVQEGNTYLSTPRLITKMKQHFNCSTINGAQLENEGGQNFGLFNLEKTIFYNEILTSQIQNGNSIISDFTFQLFQDSGFYNLMQYSPDYALWGKNKGCEFLTKSCGGEFDEFCKIDKEEGCSFLNNGQSECESDNFSNQCMYFQIMDGKNCKDKSHVKENQDLETFQYFGDDSMCIKGSLSKSQSAANQQSLSCYQYKCGANFQLKVVIDNKEYICGSKAEIINSQYSGKLTCPSDPEGFCKSQNQCKDQCNKKGYCLNKQCICKLGYSGQSCSNNCSNFRYMNECFNSCPQNTYPIESIKYCVGCPGNCQVCQNYNKCTKCNSGYKLNLLGFCDIVYTENGQGQEEEPEEPVLSDDEQYLEIEFYYEYEYGNRIFLIASIIYLILL